MISRKRGRRPRKPPHVVACAELRKRISQFEDALRAAREYLDTGAHADWHGFRALFRVKRRDGKVCPPHPDWVKNVFMRGCQRQIERASKALRRIERRRLADQCAKLDPEYERALAEEGLAGGEAGPPFQ